MRLLDRTLARGAAGKGEEPAPTPDPALLSRFESIGDNCEFGFVQRHHGIEPGGLLRWASSELDGLIRALDCDFAGLFDFDDLVPHGRDMVRDRKYDIAFHSQLRAAAEGGDPSVSAGADTEQIYRSECEKVSYLIEKLIDVLRQSEKILVYKRNAGLSRAQIMALRHAIDRYGPSRLLCVVPAPWPVSRGSFQRIGSRTRVAFIERLAPYDAVESCAYDAWTSLCHDAAADAWD